MNEDVQHVYKGIEITFSYREEFGLWVGKAKTEDFVEYGLSGEISIGSPSINGAISNFETKIDDALETIGAMNGETPNINGILDEFIASAEPDEPVEKEPKKNSTITVIVAATITTAVVACVFAFLGLV